MRYLVVGRMDENGRVVGSRYEYSAKAAAAAVARIKPECAEAFYVEDPGGVPSDYIADATAKTLTADPLPATTAPKRLSLDAFANLLVVKGVVTQDDIDAVKA